MAGVGKLNALEIEMECMDPVDYWYMHKSGWHQAGDMAGFCHYPNLANFYYDLGEDVAWLLDQVFGVNPN
jgi:hypothetical protein